MQLWNSYFFHILLLLFVHSSIFIYIHHDKGHRISLLLSNEVEVTWVILLSTCFNVLEVPYMLHLNVSQRNITATSNLPSISGSCHAGFAPQLSDGPWMNSGVFSWWRRKYYRHALKREGFGYIRQQRDFHDHNIRLGVLTLFVTCLTGILANKIDELLLLYDTMWSHKRWSVYETNDLESKHSGLICKVYSGLVLPSVAQCTMRTTAM